MELWPRAGQMILLPLGCQAAGVGVGSQPFLGMSRGAETMDGGAGMFLLGHGNVCFSSPRTGCGHVNHPGGKPVGPQMHLLVFIKKKKKSKTTIFVVGLKVF